MVRVVYQWVQKLIQMSQSFGILDIGPALIHIEVPASVKIRYEQRLYRKRASKHFVFGHDFVFAEPLFDDCTRQQ